MADEAKNAGEKRRIDDSERFRYIGFEVFPGKPKDLFTSAAEKDKLVETVRKKREKGEVIREECKLLEARVSLADRIVLTLACLAMLFALFVPWYAVYNTVVEERQEAVAPPPPAPVDSLATADSTMLTDTTALAAATEAAAEVPAEAGQPTTTGYRQSSTEEVIHGYVAKKKVQKVYARTSGLGSIIGIGAFGSAVFSSGFVLAVTGLVMLLLTLAAIGLPVYTLYGLYGFKGTPDEKALALKRVLKLNWLPLLMFLVPLVFSFLGGSYGFDASVYASLGESYGVGVFLETLSWGPFILLAASVTAAVKGVEI